MYARETAVPEDRSRNEIEKLVVRYRATNFAYANGQEGAMIGFEMKNRRIRFTMKYPEQKTLKRPPRGRWYPEEAMAQERRRLWRALALVVKAKLESVASKIETFDQAFMAHIVMPGGRTIAEHLLPEIEKMIATGKVGPLLLEADAGEDGRG